MLSGLKPCLRTLVRTTFGFLGDFHHDCQPGHRQFSVLIERAIQEELAEVVLNWLNATLFGSTFGDWGICEARMGEALAVSA